MAATCNHRGQSVHIRQAPPPLVQFSSAGGGVSVRFALCITHTRAHGAHQKPTMAAVTIARSTMTRNSSVRGESTSERYLRSLNMRYMNGSYRMKRR